MDVLHAPDEDAGARGRGAVRGDGLVPRPVRELLGDLVDAAVGRDETPDHRLGGYVVLADRRVQGGDIGEAEFAGDAGDRLVGEHPVDGDATATDLAGDEVLPALESLLAALLGKPLPDRALGTAGDHELLPVQARSRVGVLGGEDLHHLAVLQRALEGDELAVDPGADAAVADLGVDGVGEVHGGRADRQVDHVALGGEDEDLFAGHLEPEGIEELPRVGGLALPAQELAHPRHLVDFGGVAVVLAAGLLVPPVRGDAVLGVAVHLVRADLDLQRLPVGPDHGRVQGAVDAEAGLGDVVLEPARHGFPRRVDHADRRVAVPDVVAQDADAHEVVDLVELPTADDHLLIDRPVVLRSALDAGLDVGLLQVGLDPVDHGVEVDVAAGCTVGHQPDDLLVLLGLEDREGEVLEFPLHGGHAEPVCERGDHLEGLAGLLHLLLRREEAHGPHVVQAVGHLDDQDAGIVRHGDDHLADGLRLGGLAEVDLVELGDAVHQVGDLSPVIRLELFERVVGVLDRVV